MSKKIAIVDYSLGNLFSVEQALLHLGAKPEITADPESILGADAIVLPGVGAFGEAMTNLKKSGNDAAIKTFIDSGRPFLGICLGMQLLFTRSEEFGANQGLDLIKGEIKKFRALKEDKLLVPQVGWNTISETRSWNGTALSGIKNQEYMYFVHSYYCIPADEKDILSATEYGGLKYCSAVQKNNILATQFHPEKSGNMGLSIYKNWLNTI